jgi:hypothetical protein
MSKQSMTVLVIGATGSIGRLVVEEVLRQGHSVRALVRSPEKARRPPARAEAVIGDLTRADTLGAAVKDIDAIIFTHGSDGAGKVGSEAVGIRHEINKGDTWWISDATGAPLSDASHSQARHGELLTESTLSSVARMRWLASPSLTVSLSARSPTSHPIGDASRRNTPRLLASHSTVAADG